MPPLPIGIIGLGNVGGGTLRTLADNTELIERKLGFALEVRATYSRSVRNEPPEEAALFPDALRTSSWREVVEQPEIRVVAELVGGTGVAAEIVEAAIRGGKSIVTANKKRIGF